MRLGARGYSLIETLVAGGLLSLTVLAMVNMSNLNNKSAKTSRASLDYGALILKINTIFANQQACRTAFGGPGTLGVAPPPATAQDYDASSIVIYEPTLVNPNAANVLVKAGAKFGVWNVTSVQIVPMITPVTNAMKYFPAELKIGLENSEKLGGKTRTTQIFRFLVGKETGADKRIINCGPFSFATDLATDSHFAPQCGPNTVLTSQDGTRLTCLQVKCPSGAPSGYNADGTIICP